MARTPIQIEEALIGSVNSINPNFDVSKGQVRGAFLQPHASLISQVESEIDDLALRYSLFYVQSANPAVLDLYCNNHGIIRGEGQRARTKGVFFTFVIPADGNQIFIPSGTSISTNDGSISYQTVDDITVNAEEFTGLFNPATRRYEIAADLESIGIGSQFEIGARRLRKIDSPIDGLVGFDQTFPSTSSSPVEDDLSLAKRQQAKFVGLAIGTSAGVESLVRDFDPSRILDVTTVYSTEISLFKRPTRKPAFDIYVLGNDTVSFTDTFVARGGELEFVLSRQPVNNVTSITVDTIAINPIGAFVKDGIPGSINSTAALDRVKFTSPLASGTVVTVVYNYNKLLNDVQEFLLLSNNRLWRSNMLVRSAVLVPISITVTVTALSSFDFERITNLTTNAIAQVMNVNTMGVTYIPDQVRVAVLSTVAGLSNLVINQFQRQDQQGVLPVDVIESAKNEYVFLSPTDLTININTSIS